jgi:triphosphatase
MPLHEVRLDLTAAGRPHDREAMTAMLVAALPLTAESRSLVQRGLALLDHTEQLDQINAARKLTPMTGDAVLAEAGRALLATHLGKLHAAWPIAAAGVDPEGVHGMRVATRRLRAMLAALGETVYEEQTVRTLRRGLRRWAAALGAVRDADVFLQTLDAYGAGLEPVVATQLAPLRAMVEEQRRDARTALLATLASKKTTVLAQTLDDFVLTVGAGTRTMADADGAMPRTLVRHWAGSLIWSHVEQVRAYEEVLGSADDVTLHEVRIAVKHLRYTLELFKDALDSDVKALHAQLVIVQEHLGQIQDAVVAITLIDAVLHDHPDNALLHAYRAEQVQHRAALVSSAPEVVGTILALPFRRKLATVIAKI